MKWVGILSLIFVIGCCPCRQLQTHTADSSRIVIKTEMSYRFVPVPVVFDLPTERIEKTTRDTTSTLETSYARSTAAIEGGQLHHTLEQSGKLSTVVDVPERTIIRDTTIYVDRTERVTVEVAKPLSWWQQTQIKGFWLLVLVVGLYVAGKLIRLKLKL